MVQREQELKQIEERLTKLRELLDRRRTKKQEIIDLQTKVALNEADGLGFYENERPAKTSVDSTTRHSATYRSTPAYRPIRALPNGPDAPKRKCSRRSSWLTFIRLYAVARRAVGSIGTADRLAFYFASDRLHSHENA